MFMATYLKQFNNDAEYQQYIGGENAILPNVSYILDNEGVYFKPYVPPVPKNVITYQSKGKLTETTDDGRKTNGLHVYAFNSSIVSHEFVNGVGTITFEEDVNYIGEYAFYGCVGLTSIIIPDSVTSIGKEAFFHCSLTSINIPYSVTKIGNEVFYGCSLTSIVVSSGNTKYDSRENCNCIIETATNKLIAGGNNSVIPNSVTSIGNCAFGSLNLVSIEIPDSVTEISNRAFTYCDKLTSITCYASTAPSIQSDTFSEIKSDGILYVPAGSDYSSWMGTGECYLGYYNWTVQEITD